MKIQKFNQDWFTRQFGERPRRSLFDINNEIKDARGKLTYLEKQLFDWEIYHAREDAALKSFVNTLYEQRGKYK